MYIFSLLFSCPLLTINHSPNATTQPTLTCLGFFSCYQLNFPIPNPNLSVDIICDGYNACRNANIFCPKHADCNILCRGAQSCSNTNPICPIDKDCNIGCYGVESCLNSTVDCGELVLRSTYAPTTVPTTYTPTTTVPTTHAPSTYSPTTNAPSTYAPSTYTPTTNTPSTYAPSTYTPTTQSPTAQTLTTGNPTTYVPTTNYPTTIAPTLTTYNPTTYSPTLTSNPTTSTYIQTTSSTSSKTEDNISTISSDEESANMKPSTSVNSFDDLLNVIIFTLIGILLCLFGVLFGYCLKSKKSKKANDTNANTGNIDLEESADIVMTENDIIISRNEFHNMDKMPKNNIPKQKDIENQLQIASYNNIEHHKKVSTEIELQLEGTFSKSSYADRNGLEGDNNITGNVNEYGTLESQSCFDSEDHDNFKQFKPVINESEYNENGKQIKPTINVSENEYVNALPMNVTTDGNMALLIKIIQSQGQTQGNGGYEYQNDVATMAMPVRNINTKGGKFVENLNVARPMVTKGKLCVGFIYLVLVCCF